MILTDYHIHTQYSWDSKLNSLDLLNKAITHKYDAIAITEHVDLLPWEIGAHGLFSLDDYSKHVDALRKQFPQLTILKGVEVGDYHLIRDYAKELIDEFDFDLVLGALHFISDRYDIATWKMKPLNPEQILDYYRLNLDLASRCEMDVLAHLGIYKRYYTQPPDERAAMPIICDIFEAIIERGIALEINFSPYRKGYGFCIPEPWILDIYLQMGGRLFSIGGDCHHVDHFHDFRHLLPEWTKQLIFTDKKLLCLPK